MRASRSYREFYRRLLTELYGLYPETEILEAPLCNADPGRLPGDSLVFEWYSRALEADLSLTRLYEYYLYAMPENYDRLMSREVFLYFSYSANLDAGSLAKLMRTFLHMERRIRIFTGCTSGRWKSLRWISFSRNG